MERTRSSADRSLVVAAVVVREDRGVRRVLACRRTAPAAAAGRWELPGGKVEPGEDPAAALVREIGEELGCLVDVGAWLPVEAPIGERHLLRAAYATITAGELRPHEHDQVRWLAADELDSVDWLEPDRPFLPEVHAHLNGAPADGRHHGEPRAVFFDEDDARAAVAELERDGWAATATRERYQGEDDDEDHPWAVVSDAPLFVLELLVDAHDGWLDVPEERQPPVAPLDLPRHRGGSSGRRAECRSSA